MLQKRNLLKLKTTSLLSHNLNCCRDLKGTGNKSTLWHNSVNTPRSLPSINWQDSVIQTIRFNDQEYYLKRDDLLTPIAGNKARKLYGLLQTDLTQYQGVISHGGAQSNAMLAVAQLCQLLNLPFQYYTRPVPKWLKQNPLGNLRGALECGMQWEITRNGLPPAPDTKPSTSNNNDIDTPQTSKSLYIPQGISMPEAQAGLKLLAVEIEEFCETHGIKQLSIITPSGTGATALFLQQYLSHTVYTVPCIGDRQTLDQLFKELLPEAPRYPVILDTEKRYHFGEPHPELLHVYQELLASTGVEFELMYDAKTWLVLKKQMFGTPVLYIHNGGVSGNESMLARYRRLATLSR